MIHRVLLAEEQVKGFMTRYVNGITLLFLLFVAVAPVFSFIRSLYDSALSISDKYSIGFEAEYASDGRFNNHLYREDVYLIDMDRIGPGRYHSEREHEGRLRLRYTFRPNPRLSFDYTTDSVLPAVVPSGGHYYHSERKNDNLKIEYQISPRYRIASNITRERGTKEFAHTSMSPLVTSDYWSLVKNDRTVDTNRLGLSGVMTQDWGTIGVRTSYQTTDIKYHTFTLPQEKKSIYWRYSDHMAGETYDVGLNYNFNPSREVGIMGDIGYQTESSKHDYLIENRMFSYPLSISYRPSDKWQFGIETINEYRVIERGVFNRDLLTVDDDWGVVGEDAASSTNNIQLSVNRYYEHSGITLGLKLYRNHSHLAYHYQDTINTPDEKSYVWRYWDKSDYYYGAIFEFIMRPIADKIFFHTTIDYSPWRTTATREVSEEKRQVISSSFRAFFKPTRIFELSIDKSFSSTDISAYPTMIPVMVTPDLWNILEDNKIDARTRTAVGLAFKYEWGRFEVGRERHEDIEVFPHRDNILLPEAGRHPWRYGDKRTHYYINSFSTHLQLDTALSLSLSYFNIPTSVHTNDRGYYGEWERTGYSLLTRYKFSPHFSIQGSISYQTDYSTTRSISETEMNKPLAFTDSENNSTIFSFLTRYRI